MLRSPKQTVLFVKSIVDAWSTMCREESFFGRTLDQYKEEIKPVFDVRDEAAELDARWTGVLAKRRDIDTAATRLSKNIIRAVRAHPKYGEDSPLYATMGYTRESERASGLKRRPRKALEVRAIAEQAAPVSEKS
jgi:hypothetical protein